MLIIVMTERKNIKDIGKDILDTTVNLYKKPKNGYNEAGVKGIFKGIGSALGGTVEQAIATPVDLTCLVYNKAFGSKDDLVDVNSEKDDNKKN